MGADTDRNRVEREALDLSERIRRHQHEYHVLSRPSVSDAEYDRLFDRLVEIEGTYPDLKTPDSPTQRVGSDLTADLPEKRHTIPVLSLDKGYGIDDIGAWMEKTVLAAEHPLGFVLEEKIDGASVVLYYEDGLLARALTRGNGFVGNDITANIRTLGSVPLRLSSPESLAARGEVFLPIARFERINRDRDAPAANPRNLAAGTLRRVRSAEVARIPLDMYVYEGYFADMPATHVDVLDRLTDLGFKLNPRIGYFGDTDDLDSIARLHPTWQVGALKEFRSFLESERAQRQDLGYDIDGLVIKVDRIRVREDLGYTGHHPRWAIAFKFDAPQGVSRVLAVDVQVGRTGRMTPVARIEPVQIAGSTISNVTLHNQEYIDLLELAVGDVVAVSKRGDIIPAVERVVEKNEDGTSTWKMPPTCPSCGSTLQQIGAHTFCTNPEACEDQIRGRLSFFVSRDQMDIDSLGPETLDALFRLGLVRDVWDIYSLNLDGLLGEPGFAEKKIELLRQGIQNSRKRPYRVVLPSLGIPDLGQKATELLVEAGFSSIDDLLRLAQTNDVGPLVAVHGIGERTARGILLEISKPTVRERIEKLREAGLRFSEDPQPGPTLRPSFADTVWCVTGSFDGFKPRSRAADEIRRRGGRVTSAVTSKTTHLLAGDSPGSKLAHAQELGTRVVDEKEFLSLLEE